MKKRLRVEQSDICISSNRTKNRPIPLVSSGEFLILEINELTTARIRTFDLRPKSSQYLRYWLFDLIEGIFWRAHRGNPNNFLNPVRKPNIVTSKKGKTTFNTQITSDTITIWERKQDERQKAGSAREALYNVCAIFTHATLDIVANHFCSMIT